MTEPADRLIDHPCGCRTTFFAKSDFRSSQIEACAKHSGPGVLSSERREIHQQAVSQMMGDLRRSRPQPTQ